MSRPFPSLFLARLRGGQGKGLMLALVMGLVSPRAARAAGPIIPPFAGELAGEFQPMAVPGAPFLHWKLTLTTRPDDVRLGKILADGPGTRMQVALELDAAGDGTWRVVEARVELKPWLNGQFTKGFAMLSGGGTIKEGALAGEVTLRLQDIDLGELMIFADPEHAYVQRAEGRAEGTIVVRFNGSEVTPGPCLLTLPAGSTATVNFVPSPGLLTSYVPPQVLKYYPGIGAIEMGVTPLEAKVLRLTYRPLTDKGGTGAVLRIEGRPKDPKIIAPLELDVNFTGQFESIVRNGLNSRLKIGGIK